MQVLSKQELYAVGGGEDQCRKDGTEVLVDAAVEVVEVLLKALRNYYKPCE